MKDSYIAGGVIILIIILGFIFANRGAEAPVKEELDNKITPSVTLSDGKYELDIASSTISWHGEYLKGLAEEGTVNLLSGNFIISENRVKEGSFEIDMNSIESTPHKDKLVEHLKNEDFFDVENFPTATFVLKGIISSDKAGFEGEQSIVNGDLTVKGITKPISFFVTITGDENNLHATASFSINRADWEIKYNSQSFFSNLGDKIINDIVTIGLDLNAQKVIQ